MLKAEKAEAKELTGKQVQASPHQVLLVVHFPLFLAIMSTLLIVGVLVLLAAGAAFVFFSSSSSSKDSKTKSSSSADDKSKAKKPSDGIIGPVPVEDFVNVFNRVTPESTHLEILLAVLTMDDILDRATGEVDKINELRAKKEAQIQQAEAKKKDSGGVDFDDLVNDDGWGDDEEEDETADTDAVAKAKAVEKQKEEERARLRKAQGIDLPKMEGIDEGVLGQKWVEQTLTKAKAWPPKLGAMEKETFEYKGKQMTPLEHPAMRRCLCMTMGRLHSNLLNSHPELVKAGMNKAVDETYFRGSMEFRQRVAMILEAALRITLTIQNYSLFSKFVETLAAFKIGCDPADSKALPWFNGNMARQYNTLPRLDIGTLFFEEALSPEEQQKMQQLAKEQQKMPDVPKLTELEAGQNAVIVLPVDRKHAENFTKTKLAQCQKQGIPPQIALQGYREGWWFLVRWEKLEGATDAPDIPGTFLDKLDDSSKFTDGPPEMRVRTAFPMMVQNIAQKQGAVKVRLTAPKEPGTYKFTVSVKSAEFLGADMDKDITMTVKEATTSGDAVLDSEPKKDK